MISVRDANAMPPLEGAFGNWTSPIRFLKIRQITDSEGLVHDKPYPIDFKGMVQPLEPRKLYLKPEGQRSFTWLQVHAVGKHERLFPNDRIEYRERRYKVMNILDYTQNGYMEYHLLQDFEGPPRD